MKPNHILIMNNVPTYRRGCKIEDTRKILECLEKYEIDDNIINNVDEKFCIGFGIARDIIVDILSKEYWKEELKNM